MAEGLSALATGALNDLAGVFSAMPEDALDGLIEEIVKAKRIVVFGLGCEGSQMRGFAMRLFHVGRNVAVWGDTTTPEVGPGDLLIVSAAPATSPPPESSLGSRGRLAREPRWTAPLCARSGGGSAAPNRRGSVAIS